MTLPQGTEAAARVADVLLLFTDGPDAWGVSAIARELGLSKAVVHRILQTLVDRRLLVADPATRGYLLGPASAALGARALRESDLASIVNITSVGVKMPERIPPRMMAGINSAMNASLNATAISFIVARRSPTGYPRFLEILAVRTIRAAATKRPGTTPARKSPAMDTCMKAP